MDEPSDMDAQQVVLLGTDFQYRLNGRPVTLRRTSESSRLQYASPRGSRKGAIMTRSVIRSVNEAAFGGAEEADLVTSTRIPVEDCHRSMYGYCVVTDGKFLTRSLSGSEPH